MDEIKLYSVNEIAEFLQLTPRTVYDYIRAGQIKGVKIGNRWAITEQGLKGFIERGGLERGYRHKLPKRASNADAETI